MLETLRHPPIGELQVNAPKQPNISVVFPENVPSLETYEKALGMNAPLEKIPVLELGSEEPTWLLLVQLIDSRDLEEIKSRNTHRPNRLTVYLSPEGYQTLITYWTHPRFGDLLKECNKTPPTKASVRQIVTQIIASPTTRAQNQQA